MLQKDSILKRKLVNKLTNGTYFVLYHDRTFKKKLSMKILKISFILVILMATSCCTSGKTTKNETKTGSSELMSNSKKMIADGFTLGTIVASTKEGDCPYVISSEIDGNKVMYDPINLDEMYKKDGMKVWYKYNGLRMMNRCEKANPVSLEDMQPQM